MVSYKEKKKKFNEVKKQFQSQNSQYKVWEYVLEDNLEQTNIENINENFITNNLDYVIMDKKTYTLCNRLYKAMDKVVNPMIFRSVSDEVFRNHLIPGLKQAGVLIKENKFKESLGFMLAIAEFVLAYEFCVEKNSICYNMRKWVKIWKDFSLHWKKLLGKTNQQLGLYNQKSRDNIEYTLKEVQKETNEVLEMFDSNEYQARIQIFDNNNNLINENQNDDSDDNNDDEEDEEQSNNQDEDTNDDEEQNENDNDNNNEGNQGRQNENENENEGNYDDILSQSLKNISIHSHDQECDDENNEEDRESILLKAMKAKNEAKRSNIRNQDITQDLNNQREKFMSKNQKKQ